MAAPGAILAIYYFVPQAVRPLQELIQFFTGLQATWPQVEKVVEILFATPAVSGLCALLVGAFPDLRPFEVKSVLRWFSD